MKLLVLLLVASFAHAVDQDQLFVPVGLFYKNGAFDHVQVYKETFDDKGECLNSLQHIIGGMKENGSIPSGWGLVGACLPAHRFDPTAGEKT